MQSVKSIIEVYDEEKLIYALKAFSVFVQMQYRPLHPCLCHQLLVFVFGNSLVWVFEPKV